MIAIGFENSKFSRHIWMSELLVRSLNSLDDRERFCSTKSEVVALGEPTSCPTATAIPMHGVYLPQPLPVSGVELPVALVVVAGGAVP